MTISDRWAAVEAVLRAIKPELDDASLKGIKARIDPDGHRRFFARGEHPYMTRWQIAALLAVLEPALAELWKISPQAWFLLRMAAQEKGVTLPVRPGAPPGEHPALVEQLEALLAAAEGLRKPVRGRRPTLMVERAVAGACASVYFELRRQCPPTTHPDHRTRTPEPYHALVEAVFEGWRLTGWENRAVDAAKQLRAAIGESNPAQKGPI
jgi:hypothetical protein